MVRFITKLNIALLKRMQGRIAT